MKHQQILHRLDKLISQASSDPISRWTGFARVLETLIHYAESHPEYPKVHSMAKPLTSALSNVESLGQFQAVDYHDQRSEAQLRRDILNHD